MEKGVFNGTFFVCFCKRKGVVFNWTLDVFVKEREWCLIGHWMFL